MAEPRPANLALRPLELKQLFDFTIRIYRANFLPMLLAMGLLQAPVAVLSTIMVYRLLEWVEDLQRASTSGSQAQSPSDIFLSPEFSSMAALGGLAIGALAYQLLALPLAHLIVSKLAAQTVLGEPWTLRQAYSFAAGKYWATQVSLATYLLPLLALSVLLLLPVVAATATGGAAAVGVAASLSIFLIVCGLIATWLMYFRYFGAISGAVQAVEDAPGRGMSAQGVWYLKRSYALTQGYFGRVLGLTLLLAFAIAMLQNGLSKSINTIVWLVYLAFDWPHDQDLFTGLMESTQAPVVTMVTLALTSVFGLLFPAVVLCYQVLLYFDLRFRKEGLDLRLLLDSLQEGRPSATDTASFGQP